MEQKYEYKSIEKINIQQLDRRGVVYLDTLLIDARATSLQGRWSIVNDQLCFADEHIVKVSFYDTVGAVQRFCFNTGRGPGEMLFPPLAFFSLSGGDYFYSDKNQNMFIVSSDFEVKKKINLISATFPKNQTKEYLNNLLLKPDPTVYHMYEACIQGQDYVEYTGKILFPVTTEHIKFNGILEQYAAEFYKSAFNVMAIDTTEMEVEHLFCRYPPVYDKSCIPNFKGCHLATDGEYLYVNFEADYRIYIYNNQFEPVGWFGEDIEEIDDDFPETKTLQEHEALYKKHRIQCGYYGDIYCYGNYIFREYYIPGGRKGMQIYENYSLVNTTMFSNNQFTMMGFISPHYYAIQGCDVDNEEYRIVKFMIE